MGWKALLQTTQFKTKVKFYSGLHSTKNTHAYDIHVPRAAPCASVSMRIAHVGGARGGQKLCTASLVGAKRTIPGLWRLSSTCFLLLNSFLISSCSLGFYGGLTSSPFLCQSRQPSALSTRLCTWLRQIRTLWRSSHAVLPALHRQETLSPPTSSSINILM